MPCSMSLPPKIIKSYPPDVTVTVGSSDAEQQFKCYKVILCHASDYFDVMFSNDFMENSTSHVTFPDKDPNGWTLFWNYILPGSRDDIDVSNVEHVLPWFHHFDMRNELKKCDTILTKRIIDVFSPPTHDNYTFLRTEVPRLFQLARFYGMEEAEETAQVCMRIRKDVF